MPTQKDLKRRVRARMQKTGESYTAARARLLEKKKPAAKPAAPPAAKAAAPQAAPVPSGDLAAIAGMSDEAVRAKTGKGWKEWVGVLDALGAAALPHREIAQKLYDDLEVPGWWAQMITVGYERIRGLREKGQRRGGGYEVGKSKTFAVPVATLFAAFGDKERERWLDAELTVRKATANKSLRARAADGTPIEVYFTAKGAAKSQVALQHRGLASKAVADKTRALWAARLAALGELLAPARNRPVKRR